MISRKAAFGEILGYSPNGVPAYSCWYESMKRREPMDSYLNDKSLHSEPIYLGYKYQCVEYARRYLVLTHNITFESVGCAWEIFDLPHFESLYSDPVDIKTFPNGVTSEKPKAEDVLIWKRELRGTGHVAIITNVGEEFIDICEQNWDDKMWKTDKKYGRRLRLEKRAGKYFVIDPSIKGWIRFISDDSFGIPTTEGK